MAIRLICSDIDGTLTEYGSSALHLEAVAAVRQAEQAGVKVALISGRPLPWALATAAAVGASGPVAAENGGVVWWPKEGAQELAARAPALAALELLRKLPDWDESLLAPDNAWRLTDCTVSLALGVERVQQVLAANGHPAQATASGIMLHLHHPEVSKGRALELIAARLGLGREQVMALGDSGNDLSMLRAAGHAACVDVCPAAAAAGIACTRQRAGAGAARAIRQALRARA